MDDADDDLRDNSRMNTGMHNLRRFVAAFVLLLFSACGTVGPQVAKETAVDDAIPPQEIFAAGFGGITERYIKSIDVETIALEGLKGFAAIDPDLRFVKNGDTVSLIYNDVTVAQEHAPLGGDVSGWAAMTAKFAKLARHKSPDMRHASAEKLYEAVFDGVLSDLDVFSRYAGAEEARRNRARREGFGGIGIGFKIINGRATIIEIIADTPADRADLRIGDIITHVNDIKLMAPTMRSLIKKLHGATHSEVRLRLSRRATEPQLVVVLERQHIVPTTVTSKLDNNVLYLKVSGFNQDTARSLAEALEDGKRKAKHHLKGLVLDLRGNPGGLLKQSVKIADLLLTNGHIISTRGRHPDSLHYYEAGGRDLAEGLPVVLMIDGKSASASEIVAAALQDQDRAVLLGTSSFGKGTVQTVIRLPNDGEITLTWSKFIAPSGYAIHGLGVRPTICTSGFNNGDSAAILKKFKAAKFDTRLSIENWRASNEIGDDGKMKLRASCPPQRRTADIDQKLATMIINNHGLYNQALELSAKTSQAHK